jgi:hypothetical protein
MFREIESLSQREDAGVGAHPKKISSHRATVGFFPRARREPYFTGSNASASAANCSGFSNFGACN